MRSSLIAVAREHGIRFAKLRAPGPRPLLPATVLWIWLIGAGVVLVKFVV